MAAKRALTHYIAEIVNGCHGYGQINVQQYAAFETSTLFILFTQRNESQEVNQGTPLSPLLLLLASQLFLLSSLYCSIEVPTAGQCFLIQMKRIYI
jgi:hypothetical protein